MAPEHAPDVGHMSPRLIVTKTDGAQHSPDGYDSGSVNAAPSSGFGSNATTPMAIPIRMGASAHAARQAGDNESVPGSIDASPPSSPQLWSNAIMKASVYYEGSNTFLPADKFEELFQRPALIFQLEKQFPDKSPEAIKTLTDQILGDEGDSTSSESNARCHDLARKGSRRYIAAILACIDKTSTIERFIRKGIDDRSLPFTISSKDMRVEYELDGKKKRLLFMEKWSPTALNNFQEHQLKLKPPFFDIKDAACPHIEFPHDTIFPWRVVKEGLGPEGAPTPAYSKHTNFSRIQKIKIDRAHHNLAPSYGDLFAQKKLKKSGLTQDQYRKKFDNERENLRRVLAEPHVIDLLATYEWRGHFYLLFPWADGGDLKTFWENTEVEDRLARGDEDLPQWLIGQVIGIAKGLKAVHQPSEPVDGADPSHLSPNGKKAQKYGRHGDLKPSNILYFKGPDNTLGYFQITDFGSSAYHGTTSLDENISKVTGLTFCYRSPEYEIHKSINCSYDVWPLGCVLLELVGWYLCGQDCPDEFSERRCEEGAEFKIGLNDSMVCDDFFNLYTKPDEDGTLRKAARMKECVLEELDRLRGHHYCSDMLIDLLNYIEDHLLRMHSERRKESVDIVADLESIKAKIERTPSYGVLKTQTLAPTRTATQLSEIMSIVMGGSASRAPSIAPTREEDEVFPRSQSPTISISQPSASLEDTRPYLEEREWYSRADAANGGESTSPGLENKPSGHGYGTINTRNISRDSSVSNSSSSRGRRSGPGVRTPMLSQPSGDGSYTLYDGSEDETVVTNSPRPEPEMSPAAMGRGKHFGAVDGSDGGSQRDTRLTSSWLLNWACCLGRGRDDPQ